jgi:hypothetical protein
MSIGIEKLDPPRTVYFRVADRPESVGLNIDRGGVSISVVGTPMAAGPFAQGDGDVYASMLFETGDVQYGEPVVGWLQSDRPSNPS